MTAPDSVAAWSHVVRHLEQLVRDRAPTLLKPRPLSDQEVARLAEQLVAAARLAARDVLNQQPLVGMCGDRLSGVGDTRVCALSWGHPGMHRDEHHCSWGEAS